MKLFDKMTIPATLLSLTFLPIGYAAAQSNPSVVVTLENGMPNRGTLLTPPWIGIHDGTFDTYDGGAPADVPLGGNEIESLAEDGNNAPLAETFTLLTEDAPQVEALVSSTGPLSPGAKVSVTLNVDPTTDRYFSYASMIIPSNDFFIANGNPLAHEIFDEEGNFVAENFTVSGDESNDAGTEVNDEVAQNVAFLNQTAPNTGVDEDGIVTADTGFLEPGVQSFPDGVLNQPIFGNADFNDEDDRLLKVSFRYVDLGSRFVFFTSRLSPRKQIQADTIDSSAFGIARIISFSGEEVRGRVVTRGLSGSITGASLNLGSSDSNGPVVVDLSSSIGQNFILFNVTGESLTGPLEGEGFTNFLNELAAGNIYMNIQTADNPEGELRGQVYLK